MDLSCLDIEDAVRRATLGVPGEEVDDSAVVDGVLLRDDVSFPALADDPVKSGAIKVAKGTTTLAFVFQGGVCMAVDSRATMGSAIGSNTVQKVIPIRDTSSGRWLEGRRIVSSGTGDSASKMLGNTLYSFIGYGLSCYTMVGGWDKTGPHLYCVDSEGTRLKGDRFSLGSGSTFAYGVMDAGYRFDMTEEEACELGRRAIYHATHRDAFSGGVVNVYLVTKDGWRKVSSHDSAILHDTYSAE